MPSLYSPFQRPADSLLVAERRPACNFTNIQTGLVQRQLRNPAQTDLVLAIAIGVPRGAGVVSGVSCALLDSEAWYVIYSRL